MAVGRARVLVVMALVASMLVIGAPGVQAEQIPQTLADRRPVGRDAVRTSFSIDYVGVLWDVPAGARGPGHAADAGHAHGDAPHGEIRLRHRGRWGSWIPLVEDGAQAEGRWTGGLVPAGDAEAYQVRGLPPDALEPRAVAINTTDGPPRVVRRRPASAHALPLCVSRYDWGADESLRTDDRAFADVQVMTVHHTATSNDDDDPEATVRAIYRYHTVDNGWDDIGYQYLLDGQGRLYEGRWSGADSEPCQSDPQDGPGTAGVIGDGRDFAHDAGDLLVTGAHTGGYNTGNVGIAVLGDFRDHPRFGAAPPEAAVEALEDTLAGLATRHGFTRGQLVGDDQVVYDNGVNRAVVDAISAHRDFKATECPGERLYDQLPAIRLDTADKAEQNAAPEVRILEPADGTAVASGTSVRFSAGVADDDAAPADVVWASEDAVLHVGGSFEAALPDGTHTVTATVTDAANLSDSAPVVVTVGGDVAGEGTIHVGGLTDVSTDAAGPNWEAGVEVLVHDGGHLPAADVVVTGTWEDGTEATCTTNHEGICTFTRRLHEREGTTTTFSVLGLARSGDTYAPEANHDPAGDPPTITLVHP